MLDAPSSLLFSLGAVFGLLIGSAINAMVWRLHTGESWARGRSKCPGCGHELAARDLVPVLSWLLLKGKCRYCRKPISRQYPLVELLTALLFGLSAARIGVNSAGAAVELGFWFLMLTLLLVMAVYDAKWKLLPTSVMAPAIVLAAAWTFARAGMEGFEARWVLPYLALGALVAGLAVSAWLSMRGARPGEHEPTDEEADDPRRWLSSLLLAGMLLVAFALWRFSSPLAFGPLAAAFGAALFFDVLTNATKGRGMGGGDVNLAFLMGLILGIQATLVALFAAFNLGALGGLALLARQKMRRRGEDGRRMTIPFGPYLVAGTVIAFLYGRELAAWYLGLSSL